MPKINVYLPDALAREVRRRGLSVSPICQRALRAEVMRSQNTPALDSKEHPMGTTVLNSGPDGEHYPFGEIVATHYVGPYAITTVVDDNGRTTYATYVRGEQVLADGWNSRVGWTRTSVCFESFDEALVYLVAYRHVGPNVAGPVVRVFMKGLEAEAGV